MLGMNAFGILKKSRLNRDLKSLLDKFISNKRNPHHPMNEIVADSVLTKNEIDDTIAVLKKHESGECA